MQSHAMVHQGTTDCHVHVFGPQDQYPFIPVRRYTPDDATIEDYLAAVQPLGVERFVLSAPSVHGTDNSAMLGVLARHKQNGRGIAMVTADVGDEELGRLHAGGARGIRTQLKADGGKPLQFDEFRALAARIEPLGWHVEVHLDVSLFDDADTRFADFPVPVVIEHMGHMHTDKGVDHPGFQALLRFAAAGGWVKLSGAYINSVAAPPHNDVTPFARAILAAAPERSVWGSNWPHPHQDPIPDDALQLDLLTRWADGDAALLQRVLVENPAELYDFPAKP